MSLCKNIVDWDDSGAQENFKNEKAWFWADLNGVRCEIPLPAPDFYLDKVDYDAEIDAMLVADLERPPPQLLGWDCFNRVPVTGWCDGEDPVQSNWETTEDKLIVPTGWVDEGYPAPHTGFVVSGFSAGNNGLNEADRNYSQGWVQKNSGDFLNYFTAWHNNNLLGWGQDWRNGRNDSWVSLENKTNSRNFIGRKREDVSTATDGPDRRTLGNNGREGCRMGFAYHNAMYDNRPLAMR